ncbi:Hypothetical_protein [Hexamita inflata]|uniref:Hypothetical_protein n=1 Tax=Hexamita inflata TaxID=28002 RepID=A0ABP1HDM5_9EUKA
MCVVVQLVFYYGFKRHLRSFLQKVSSGIILTSHKVTATHSLLRWTKQEKEEQPSKSNRHDKFASLDSEDSSSNDFYGLLSFLRILSRKFAKRSWAAMFSALIFLQSCSWPSLC